MMEYVRTRYTRTLAELMEEDNFQLFDFDYTFPEGHKAEMENYVINWFSEDEIGAETPSAFKRMFIPLFMKHIPLCAQWSRCTTVKLILIILEKKSIATF